MELLLFYEFLSIEVWIFIINAILVGLFFLDFIWTKIFIFFQTTQSTLFVRKKRLIDQKNKKTVSADRVIDFRGSTPKKTTKKTLSKTQKEKISEILKQISANSFRLGKQKIRELIIEGLSIDKNHKELNLLLAKSYEDDMEYKKAEILYRDLILSLENKDVEVYKRLSRVLSLQGKDLLSFEILKKCHEYSPKNKEILREIIEICHDREYWEEGVTFAKIFIRFVPKDIKTLHFLSQAYMGTGRHEEALELLKTLQNIDPYNLQIKQMIEKVSIEIEMKNNMNTDNV